MGLDIHLHPEIRLANELDMNSQPIDSIFKPRYRLEHEDGHIKMVEGQYSCTHMPAITPSEIDIQIGQIIGQENSQLLLFRIEIGPLEIVVFDV